MHHNRRKQRKNGKKTAMSYILRLVVQTYYSAFCFSLFQNLQKPQPEKHIANTMLSHSEHSVTHLSTIGARQRAHPKTENKLTPVDLYLFYVVISKKEVPL